MRLLFPAGTNELAPDTNVTFSIIVRKTYIPPYFTRGCQIYLDVCCYLRMSLVAVYTLEEVFFRERKGLAVFLSFARAPCIRVYTHPASSQYTWPGNRLFWKQKQKRVFYLFRNKNILIVEIKGGQTQMLNMRLNILEFVQYC